MGTRADFYIGRGTEAEWLGSVAWDGYEWDEKPDCDLMRATSPDAFRLAVSDIQKDRDDFTEPSQGWPWPWEDSNTTDYVYVLHEGKVTAYCFGRETCINADGAADTKGDKVDWFPNMSARMAVAFSGKRSGLIVLRGLE